jgi:hypothetical protein
MNFYFLPKPWRLRHVPRARLGGQHMDCETENDETVVAEYVADLTAELAVMAAWAEHVELARILEMARLESERLCGRTSDTAEPEITDTAAVPETTGQQQTAAQPPSTNVVLLSALRAARR